MDVLKAMEADADIAIKELRVDGGATANDLLMQFQSDVLQTKVVRPRITETTALGAAYLAGLAVGYWPSLESIQNQWQVEKAFTASSPADAVAARTKGWQQAIHTTIAGANIDV